MIGDTACVRFEERARCPSLCDGRAIDRIPASNGIDWLNVGLIRMPACTALWAWLELMRVPNNMDMPARSLRLVDKSFWANRYNGSKFDSSYACCERGAPVCIPETSPRASLWRLRMRDESVFCESRYDGESRFVSICMVFDGILMPVLRLSWKSMYEFTIIYVM